jgi:hypothetical protein
MHLRGKYSDRISDVHIFVSKHNKYNRVAMVTQLDNNVVARRQPSHDQCLVDKHSTASPQSCRSSGNPMGAGNVKTIG